MSIVEPPVEALVPVPIAVALLALALALGVRDILEVLSVRSPRAGAMPETWEGPGFVMGAEVFVDK